MIKEDYVSFKTAKLLKKKGFDWGCDMYYTEIGSVAYTQLKFNHNEIENRYSRPTLQMAMKWLREVHNIIIDIAPNLDGDMNIYSGFCGIIYEDGSLVTGLSNEEYTYEQATEAAIYYCLENLI